MSCITTYTGIHIDPLSPKPEQLDIRDIAHALSLTCRGNGHVKTFFSVGQHCLNCAKEAIAQGLSREICLACLVHDAGEAYMSDVPRPLKAFMPAYREAEDRILSVIYQKFIGRDLTGEEAATVKVIDDEMLWFDLTELLNEPQDTPAPQVHIDISYEVRPFSEVEREYLELFETLNR